MGSDVGAEGSADVAAVGASTVGVCAFDVVTEEVEMAGSVVGAELFTVVAVSIDF